MAMLPNTDISKNLALQIQIYTTFYACLEYCPAALMNATVAESKSYISLQIW